MSPCPRQPPGRPPCGPWCAFRARVLHCHCHQSKRYSGAIRSAHGVQRATVGSSQLSGFDCFQASSRMHQSTVHCALDLVVGGVHYETFAVPTGRSRKFSRHPESRKPDTWPGFDQVVGGSIRCGCNPITPLLEVWSLASGGDGVSNNNLAPATPTKKPPRWAVWLRSGGGSLRPRYRRGLRSGPQRLSHIAPMAIPTPGCTALAAFHRMQEVTLIQ